MLPTRTELRAELRLRRHGQSHPSSAELLQRFSSLTLPERARIASYASHGTEFPTTELNQWLLERGHQVYVPRVIDVNPPQMVFHQITAHSLLTPGRFGIDEPSVDARPAHCFEMMLLPVLGADRRGNRLGQGLGFYDRYLRRYRDLEQTLPLRVGLAWSAQLLDSLVPESWDVPLDYLLTEDALIRCS